MIKVSGMTPNHSGTLPIDIHKFPCGESFVRLDTAEIPVGLMFDQITVCLAFQENSDLVDLLLVVDAIKRSELMYKKLALVITYFPYGRQDRVCNIGEPHSLKVVANLINSCGFSGVFVFDPHSDVIEALIDNVIVIPQDEILKSCIAPEDFCESGNHKHFIESYDAVVSPDAGAYKKVFKVAQEFNKNVVRADKIRNLKDGSLSGFEVYAEELTGQSVLIVDDICDGGGTFLGLAQKLREKGAEKVSLYVTHGMFTKGVDILLEHLDKIYCYGYHGKSTEDAEKISILEFIG